MWNYVRRTLFCLICCGSGFLIKPSASILTTDTNTTATPSVKIVPQTVGNFIYYEKHDTITAKPYIDSIKTFLSDYNNANQVETLRYCDFDNSPREDSACVFDKRNLGPCSESEDFGFFSGTPCLFFTLSQVLNWTPVVLNSSEIQLHSDPFFNIPNHLNSTLADSEQSMQQYVWLTCDGENAADKEFIGPVTYYPHKGFPTYYFPFTNVDGYQSPIVAVHFRNPQKGMAISIECRAWAKNIQLNRNTGVGFVKFLLLIEY